MRSICRVVRCGKFVASHGRCDRHHKRWMRQHVPGFCKRERDQRRLWTHKNRVRQRKVQNVWAYDMRQRHRALCLAAYGGRCKCCGESISAFLTLDHVKGGGRKHRIKHHGHIHRWAIKHKFPKSLRLLCWNCNSGRAINGGVCPHEEKKHVT